MSLYKLLNMMIGVYIIDNTTRDRTIDSDAVRKIDVHIKELDAFQAELTAQKLNIISG